MTEIAICNFLGRQGKKSVTKHDKCITQNKMKEMSSNPRWGKARFSVLSKQNTEFILVLLFTNYCITFHMNNCKLLLPHPAYQKLQQMYL